MSTRFTIFLIVLFVVSIITIDMIFDKAPLQNKYHITCLDGIEYWESNFRDVLAVRFDVSTMQPARCICK